MAAEITEESDDEQADIAAAIQASRQQDAALPEAVGEGSEDEDRQEAVVHFPGAYQAHQPRLKQQKPAKPKPAKGAVQAQLLKLADMLKKLCNNQLHGPC